MPELVNDTPRDDLHRGDAKRAACGKPKPGERKPAPDHHPQHLASENS
jgi:hypothetical protein